MAVNNMADAMKFPKTMKEFIDGVSFKDRDEVYTNGSMLIPTFRVEQAIEHYDKEIRNKVVDEFAERLKSDEFQKYNLDMVFETSRDLSYSNCVNSFCEYIDEIAEQMKGGE